MDWGNRSLLDAGCAFFIGAYLVDALVEMEASVRVVENLISGLWKISFFLIGNDVPPFQLVVFNPKVI